MSGIRTHDVAKIIGYLKVVEVPWSTAKIDFDKAMLNLRTSFFARHLMYVLAKSTKEGESLRSQSGLILRDNIGRSFLKFQPETVTYMRNECLPLLENPSACIRNTAGSLLSIMACKWGIWEDLCTKLKEMASSNSDDVMRSTALHVLIKIWEDCIAPDLKNERLSTLVLENLSFLEDRNEQIRFLMLALLHLFLLKEPSADHVDNIVTNAFPKLIVLSKDKSNQVGNKIRMQACRILTKFLDFPDQVNPYMMDEIIKNMLLLTEDDDDGVARMACEFWLSLVGKKELLDKEDVGSDVGGERGLKRPRLDSEVEGRHPTRLEILLKSLVKGMRLPGGDRGNDTKSDWNNPDEPQDVRPRFHHRCDGDFEKEDDPLLVGAPSDCNLRSSASTVLEQLAHVFSDTIIPQILPILRETFAEESWEAKESAVLALGAIALGCQSGMKNVLPELLDSNIANEAAFLSVGLFAANKSLVRSACWTLGRCANFIVSQDQYLKPVITKLLNLMFDPNKSVQGAVCSALTMFTVEGGQHLTRYLDRIIRRYGYAIGIYQRTNRAILYDAIGALARSFGSELNKPSYIELFVPPLLKRWSALEDNDLDILPLLECFSSVATALQLGFVSHFPPIFIRCIQLVKDSLAQLEDHTKDPDLEFMILPLDLLSCITEGVGSEVEPHIGDFVVHLITIIRYPIPEVQQPAFALLSNLTIACFEHVRRSLPTILDILARFINKPESCPPMCSNAILALLGEIAIKMGTGMTKHLSNFHFRGNNQNETPLVKIINLPDAPKILLENTAITLGRLGWVVPKYLGKDLESFAKRWCNVMQNLPDGVEKETAFRGILNMISVYPDYIAPDFFHFCNAVASWVSPPADLQDQFQTIFQDFKIGVSDDHWNRFMGQMTPELRQKIMAVYNV